MTITKSKSMVIFNKYQTDAHRVLCVCSGGVLRSPTAAWLLSGEPWNFNTRSCGSEADFALIPLTEELVAWADEVVCMEELHAFMVQSIIEELSVNKNFSAPLVHTLDVPDDFHFRQPELVGILQKKFEEIF